MIVDCHMHTKISMDSKLEIEHAIEKSKELDLGLVITEHMDLNFPEAGQFLFDPEVYFKEYSKYRNNKLFLGMELGMQEICLEEGRAIVEKYDFDQIIGSIHIVNGIDIYQKVYYAGKSKQEAYSEYLMAMKKNLKLYNFVDTLGHIDYITRYAAVADKEIYFEEYRELIDEVLKTVISNGQAIELNTRRISQKAALDNLFKIYSRYKELGGQLITIGSDAHVVENIGCNFKTARELTEAIGLKAVYYKNRKPEYMF